MMLNSGGGVWMVECSPPRLLPDYNQLIDAYNSCAVLLATGLLTLIWMDRRWNVDGAADPAVRCVRPRLDGCNPEAIPGVAHLGAIEAENLGGHAELEGAQAVIGERHHEAVLERLWSPSAFWHDLYAPWHLRHLSRTPSVPSNLL